MCLGIPGRIVEILDAEKHFGRAEILGSTRPVQLGMLEPEVIQIGIWVLINAGWAVQLLEADEASEILHFITTLEQHYEEEQP